MDAIIGIGRFLALVAAVIWLGTRTGETDGNGDNVSAARRYGQHG